IQGVADPDGRYGRCGARAQRFISRVSRSDPRLRVSNDASALYLRLGRNLMKSRPSSPPSPDFEDWESPAIFKPLAPTSGIGGAPLPKGGSFLSHLPSRSASVP